ncbi:hypothetical protein TNCV_4728101 [Trichonephila clavipes]|nr:hypothetical protein TNCV_4728101 [Trichonephila clavipes]
MVKMSVALQFRIPLKTEKMIADGFEIITSNSQSLKEVVSLNRKKQVWANRRIAHHICRSDAAIRRCWQGWMKCLARSDWNPADLGPVVFTNEFHYQLCPDDYRGRVWRSPG